MTQPQSAPQPQSEPRKPGGMLPWILLALWFLWLGALMAMSWPEWGKSKRELLEKHDRPSHKVRIPAEIPAEETK